MSKQFNPDTCPYAQLKKHKGSAIIFVDNNNSDYAGGDYDMESRTRFISRVPFTVEDFAGRPEVVSVAWRMTRYSLEGERSRGFRPCCYQSTGNTYLQNIEKMEQFDKMSNLEIIFIEFYE